DAVFLHVAAGLQGGGGEVIEAQGLEIDMVEDAVLYALPEGLGLLHNGDYHDDVIVAG
ncbi:MAG: hypothetical protein H6Q39_1750, partial [Chloroflexi bacterium]|nr:hypothetical protein [Chloroflexota bacterium]